MADFGRETIVFFEIDIPFCSLTYGVGACPAVLGTDSTLKCYQTRATCPVPLSFDGDSRTSGKYITLRFCRPQDAVNQYGPVIPMIAADPSTTPAVINLAGMDRNMGPLGQREAVSVVMDDSRWSDNLVDKYRLERASGAASSTGETFDPYTRGTFWGKFIARNRYYVGWPCRIREGFVGDDLEDMRVRNYVIDKIDGPTNGRVKITAKDVFSLIEARKAVAPVATSGELLADISAVAGSATLSPAGIGDEEYPASGYLCIGDEIVAFTRVADALTLTARGQLGTTAAEHKQEDNVQLVLQYSSELFQDIVYDLLANYSAVPPANLPTTEWAAALTGIADVWSRVIPRPTPVLELLGSLLEVAGVTIIPDVATGDIELVPLRASTPSVTVDDEAWLKEEGGGEVVKRNQDVKRVSQLWLFYGQRDPTGDPEDEENYHSRLLDPDLDAESPQQYGVPAIRKVFGVWIPQFGRSLAAGAAARIKAVFRDPPDEVEFTIVASRDGELSLARPFLLEIAEVQDETGAVASVMHVPVSLARGENEIRVQSQEIVFSGSDDGGGSDRTIFIENNSFNLNLRTIHDLLYAEPTGSETVTFVVQPGITVGSTSTSLYAIETGDWPEGQPLFLTIQGRIQGKGGAAGNGGDELHPAGYAGSTGGVALHVTVPITIDNSDGELWAGGGGGGGGAIGLDAPGAEEVGGGGGGGGAGTNAGAGGVGGSAGCRFVGSPGSSGTSEAGGAHGAGAPGDIVPGADGGDGGAPGSAGSAGGSTGVPGGAGGPAGFYIVGNSLVTWTATGDRRGNVL